ncbi:MAG: D-alanyl-D-alanine carboxypeptidase [Rhodocyclaceae bacterium]|nr:D-alanyl-D-alanine carboxypeptidase [Rhodocyclaceae bacterium]
MPTFLRPLGFILALLPLLAAAQFQAPAPSIAASAWLLIDHGSGQTLAAANPDQRIEPASLTKLMTAYLTFAALKQGTLKPDQVVPVSEKAWRASGSRMFIEPKRPVKVDELIKGMIVQSGNDACVALAEAIAGSEATFVESMNREAQRMGLTATRYANSTGMPDAQHYSTARDLARLTQALIRDFPGYYPIYSTREFRYNAITQPNRNRLLWLDPTVDGVKTGHTESAGYCLIASAKRGPRRLISVVLGTDSDATRAQESLRLINHGFLNFDAYKLYDKARPISRLKVFKGAENTVAAGFPSDFLLSLPKGVAPSRIKIKLASRQPLLAPVQRGAMVATLSVFLDEQHLGDYPVEALEDVAVAGFVGRSWDTLKLWFE